MIFYVLDRNLNCISKIDDEASESAFYHDDTFTVGLVNGTKLRTLDWTIDKASEGAEEVQVGTYLVFRDENGENVCLTLMDVREGNVCHYEDLGMELINENPMTFSASYEQPIAYYVNREIYDSGWEIGLNEIKDAKRKVAFNSGDTTLSRLQTLCTEYNCEMYFSVEFQNLKVTRKYINIVQAVGTETSDVLKTGHEILTISKSVNINQLITALIVDSSADFSELVFNDGNYFTRIGESIIYDREANAIWGRGHTTDTRDGGWIYGSYSSQETSPAGVFADGLAYLKTRNQPSAAYSVEAIFDLADYNIGDYVTLIDEESKPALRLSARILEMSVSRTNKAENKLVIGNAVELKNQISSKLDQLQNQINQKPETSVRTQLTVTEDGTMRHFRMYVFDGEKDITSTLKNYQFYWTLKDKDGNEQTAWMTANDNAGPRVSIDLNSVRRDQQLSCRVMYEKNKFVQEIYFINGLTALASRIMRLQTDDTVVIPFITDSHYATDTFAYDDIDHYLRSANHVRNVAELTYKVDCDAIVGGGDFVDGGTTKEVNMANMRTVVSMFGLAKCPFFLCLGNHDDNSWGDGRQGRATTSVYKVPNAYQKKSTDKSWHGNMGYVIKPPEMYELITRPSTIWDIKENPDDKKGYFYYDVPGKKLRIIILNPQDVPYTYDTDGTIKYQTINVAGYRQPQLNWFKETLLSVPEGYHIACFQHMQWGKRYNANAEYYPYNWETVDGLITAYHDGGTFSREYTDNPDFKSSITATFSKGRPIALLAHGHHHRDKLSTSGGITNVATGCSAARPKKEQSDRPLGQLTEDLWDVFVINTKKRHVDVLRFGQGSDRQFDY